MTKMLVGAAVALCAKHFNFDFGSITDSTVGIGFIQLKHVGEIALNCRQRFTCKTCHAFDNTSLYQLSFSSGRNFKAAAGFLE